MLRAALLTVTLLAAACDGGAGASGVADSAFVGAMAALRRVNASGRDTLGRVAARDSILKVYSLTPAGLEAAARRLARDPGRAQAVWSAIEAKVADTLPRGVRPPRQPKAR
jgi:hypothetical protein